MADPKRFEADPGPIVYADADPDWNFFKQTYLHWVRGGMIDVGLGKGGRDKG